MSALALLRDPDLLLGKTNPTFSLVACTVICACKSRWLRNKRRSYCLWSTAASQVSPTLKAYLNFLDDELRDPPTRVLALVSQSIQKDNSKSWKFTKNTGEEVLVRDILSRIVRWIDRFKEVGTNIVQYDPVHAALPWAAICFCLDVALSNVKNYTAYVDGLEQMARVIAEYAEYQKDLLGGRSKFKRLLEAAIVSLYLAILNYLAEARRYLESSTSGRLARNVVHTSTPKAVELLDAVEKHRAYAARLVDAVQHENEYQKLTNVERSLRDIETALLRPTITLTEKRNGLLRRLAPVFTNDTLDLALGKCQQDTATWILDRDVFQRWSELPASVSKLLWMHGPPGTGKTIISAKIIQHLQSDTSRFVAYFFCANEDEARRDPNALIRSCIAQYIEQVDLAANLAYQIFDGKLQRPLTTSEVWSCFAKLCSQIPNCTFVIDGFDECSNAGPSSKYSGDDAKSLFLRELIGELSKTNALVLLVSRDDADIRTEILGNVPANVAFSQYKIQKDDQEQDIGTITQRLIDQKLGDRPQRIREEIAKDAAEKSDGMILWVQLLSKEFRPKTNFKALRRIVSEMPAGIEQAYARDLARLAKLNRDDTNQAIHILRWMLFSSRPMTVGEIVEALIMRNFGDGNEYPADELPDEWDGNSIGEEFATDLFRRMLGSLIDLRSSSDDQPVMKYTVHFVHYSVKEYLLRPGKTGVFPTEITFSSAAEENTRLAALCLRYLCFDVFDVPSDPKADDAQTNEAQAVAAQADGVRASTPKPYPFSSYAAENWFWHAAHEDPISSELVPLVENLLDPSTLNWLTWSNVFEPTIRVTTSVYDPRIDQDTAAVRFVTDDDRRWIQWPLKCRTDEPKNEHGEFQIEHTQIMNPQPLYYASVIGIIDVVKNFWSRGYRGEDSVGRLGSPLHAAVYQRHKQLVSYLIEKGAKVEDKAGPFGYALIAAAAVDEEDIFQFLLDHGARPGCSNDLGNTAAHHAARNANVKVLQKLVEHRVDLNVVNNDGVTALHCAARSGNIDVVRTLLDAGVSIDAVIPQGLWYGTALHIAVGNGRREMASLLLSRGADVHKVGYYGMGCLHLATDSGDGPTLDLILTTDIEIDKAENSGLIALHFAVIAGDLDVMDKLISKGADINYRSLDNFTPLFLAVLCEREALAGPLIEKGADVDIPCNDGIAPLGVAVCSGMNDLAELLLEKGADVNQLYKTFSISLLAILSGNADMVEILMQHGVDTIGAQSEGVCALAFACYLARDLRTVKLLLGPAGPSSSYGPSRDDCTQALYMATKTAEDNIKLEIVQILLDYHADPFEVHRKGVQSAFDYALAKPDDSSLGLMMQHQPVCLSFLSALHNDVTGAMHLMQTFFKHDFEGFQTNFHLLQASSRQILLNQMLLVAFVFNFEEGIDYLLKEGASMRHRSEEGRNALHYAAIRRDEQAIRKAVEHGALVDEVDKNSCRPVEYAIRLGLSATSVVEYLLRKEIELDLDTKKPCSSALTHFWRDNAHSLFGDSIGSNGETNPLSPVDIVPWPSLSADETLNEAPRFTGIRDNELAPLRIYGLLHGEDQVMWLQMNVTVGSIYRGKVNVAERKIVGQWGYTSLKDEGPFTMVVESKEAKEQRLAADLKGKRDDKKKTMEEPTEKK